MGADNEETAIGERLMPPGENSGKGGPDAVSSTSRPVDDPRVYLASERTFLAWIRTSISLMGFGFVIARFALWTREFGFSGKPATLAGQVQVSRHGSALAWSVLVSVFPFWRRFATAAISAISSGASPTRPCTSRPR